MSKYKVGDKVKCINVDGEGATRGGAGWKMGRSFIVSKVGFYSRSCYFSKGENGVYEEYLKLVKVKKLATPMKYIIIDRNGSGAAASTASFKTRAEVKEYVRASEDQKNLIVYELGPELKITTKISLRKVK